MSFIKKNLFLYALLFFSIYITTFFWKFLHIPYNSDIVGEYSINNYNAINDILKYLFFILFPLSVYVLSRRIIFNDEILKNLKNLKIEKQSKEFTNNLKYIFFILILSLIFVLDFISISWITSKIDIFHAGQKLYPAFKYITDKSIWSETYIIVGAFYEVFLTVISWKLLGAETIGASIVGELFLVLITKILLIFLIYQVSKLTNFKFSLKILYFFTLSFFSIYLIDFNIYSGDLISWRDLPILLTLFLFFLILNDSNNKNFISFIIGMVSIAVFLWSIDRAIINTALLLFICLFFVQNKLFKELIYLFVSIIFSIFFIYFSLDKEFYYFIENTFLILKEINNIHGLIHPLPFSDDPNASRATKTLLFILSSLIISFNLILNIRSNVNNNFKILLLTISILSFFTYIHAIGRSDGGHIKQAFGFPIIFFTILIVYYLFNYLNKLLNLESLIEHRLKYVLFFFSIIFLFNSNFDVKKILNFNNSFNEFVTKEDKHFISNEDYEFILEVNKIIDEEKCIQLYTNDSILLYLLKKTSCSKYYWPWSYGSSKTQEFLINNLNDSKFIITNGYSDNWGTPFNKKFIILDPYIKTNFSYVKTISNRAIRYKN